MEGYVKVATAIPRVYLADCNSNTLEIESLIAQAAGQHAQVVCFPELCITGYSCQDLFQQQHLLKEAEYALFKLLEFEYRMHCRASTRLQWQYI